MPGDDVPSRFIGGNLKTLLHMTQLAAISQDPWFSRVNSLEAADHVALDLDPSEGVPFARVLDVARWIHDELEHLGTVGFPKTSGADGLHIYIPLPPGIPYEAGLLFCQIVATVVAQKHPQVATVERHVKARGPRVYVDYLQNILGKTLATAYSARASDYAGRLGAADVAGSARRRSPRGLHHPNDAGAADGRRRPLERAPHVEGHRSVTYLPLRKHQAVRAGGPRRRHRTGVWRVANRFAAPASGGGPGSSQCRLWQFSSRS